MHGECFPRAEEVGAVEVAADMYSLVSGSWVHEELNRCGITPFQVLPVFIQITYQHFSFASVSSVNRILSYMSPVQSCPCAFTVETEMCI